ncbi:DUF2178 domain-containing protein [Deinococcus marmoris]|uniref:Uncharacterized protein n=1 Tax=Deinococcus marmoris TaxID=249408 RepID=A0A1U7NS30_9DEIO|nr:DUF2178 domain-containing protein [Deinococcus marmoris]OLV15715.1 hypothetical protein BOO71_0014050 [Deinococcus marmoris]
MTAFRKDETTPRSFREKVAWVNFLTTLVLYVPAFVIAWRWLASGGLDGTASGLLSLHLGFLPVIILQVILIPLGLAAFWLTGQRAGEEQADERDRTIEARASRAAYLSLIVLMGVGFYTLLPFALSDHAFLGLPPGGIFSPVSLVLLGFMAFVTAENVRFGVQAFSYRRGF